MSGDTSFPDLIAERARSAARTLVAAGADAPGDLDDLVGASVLAAFGCSCAPGEQAGRAACSLHGARWRTSGRGQDAMPSRVASWSDDPYDGYSAAERREGVQGGLRGATEVTRSFRSELAATLRRGQAAEERLADELGRALHTGGLTPDELALSTTALAAVQYSLRLLYAASNHVGDQPDSEQYR
jgi:hypothetical protein